MKLTYLLVTLSMAGLPLLVPAAGAETVVTGAPLGAAFKGGVWNALLIGTWAMLGLSLLRPSR